MGNLLETCHRLGTLPSILLNLRFRFSDGHSSNLKQNRARAESFSGRVTRGPSGDAIIAAQAGVVETGSREMLSLKLF